MSILIDTTTVDHRERGERWADAHERLFFPVGVNFTADGRSQGRIEGREFGPVGAFRVWSDPSVVRRNRTAISVDDPERFLVALPVSGHCSVAQRDRSCRFTVGEMSSWESSHPFEVIHHERFELMLVVIPTDLLGHRRDTIADHTAVCRTATAGVGMVTASLISQLLDRRITRADQAGEEDIADALISLIRAIHRADLDPPGQAAQAPSSVLLDRIKDHIERNLEDHRLSPETIAASHFISKRYLHKLFSTEAMTVSEWIRHRRLEACRRDLRTPSLAHEPIAAVARRWALADPTHFSRVFRATYGCTPSEYRHGPGDR